MSGWSFASLFFLSPQLIIHKSVGVLWLLVTISTYWSEATLSRGSSSSCSPTAGLQPSPHPLHSETLQKMSGNFLFPSFHLNFVGSKITVPSDCRVADPALHWPLFFSHLFPHSAALLPSPCVLHFSDTSHVLHSSQQHTRLPTSLTNS